MSGLMIIKKARSFCVGMKIADKYMPSVGWLQYLGTV